MRLRVLLLCVLVALLASEPAAPADSSQGELSLGEPGLKEIRTTEQIVPGVTYTRIVRGQQSSEDFYTVDVAFEADHAAAEEAAYRLMSDGYEPVIVEASSPQPSARTLSRARAPRTS